MQVKCSRCDVLFQACRPPLVCMSLTRFALGFFCVGVDTSWTNLLHGTIRYVASVTSNQKTNGVFWLLILFVLAGFVARFLVGSIVSFRLWIGIPCLVPWLLTAPSQRKKCIDVVCSPCLLDCITTTLTVDHSFSVFFFEGSYYSACLLIPSFV